jgi:ATP-dependent helicase YprA (DUF1998 family)
MAPILRHFDDILLHPYFYLHLEKKMAPVQSKVKQYLEGELDLQMISEKSYQTLGVHPFRWQLEAAAAILCGRDVVLDVRTGSGKSLCFSLPLLLNEKDISITVSPLTALMIDQVSASSILKEVKLRTHL